MGALSAAVVTDRWRVRGNHPICSFSAVGPLAQALIEGQRPHAVWSPLERLVDMDGAVVLMGVSLTSLTLAHLAEQRVGRRPFIRWAATKSEGVCSVEVGSCSDGFSKFAPSLAEVFERRMVGSSEWTAMSARDAFDRLVATIAASPTVTRCSDPECERCRDAIAGGPVG